MKNENKVFRGKIRFFLHLTPVLIACLLLVSVSCSSPSDSKVTELTKSVAVGRWDCDNGGHRIYEVVVEEDGTGTVYEAGTSTVARTFTWEIRNKQYIDCTIHNPNPWSTEDDLEKAFRYTFNDGFYERSDYHNFTVRLYSIEDVEHDPLNYDWQLYRAEKRRK